MSKKSLIKGTVVLTSAGLITRLIGFFYKIYLSRLMGAEALGLYQLIFPVYGICFTVYASGIQTAVSKLTAEHSNKHGNKNPLRILFRGLILSVSLAVTMAALIYIFSEQTATYFLLEARTAGALRMLCLTFPFCALTSCINGYYYGLRQPHVPAATQIIEQVIRIAAVLLAVSHTDTANLSDACELAVFGIVAGEAASALFNLLSLAVTGKGTASVPDKDKNPRFSPIIKLAVPLSANRLLINLLHSLEAVLLPVLLRKSGMDDITALGILGILNGMTMSILMFPGTFFGSLSVLLLPEISNAAAEGNTEKIKGTVSRVIAIATQLGLLCTAVFVAFGTDLCALLFGEIQAGIFLRCLAWLCPAIYINNTLTSVLNGLGRAHITFINSIISSVFRLLLMFTLIPAYGIYGYFIASLAGQLLATALDIASVRRKIRFQFDAIQCLLKPGIVLLLSSTVFSNLYSYLEKETHIPKLPLLIGICACLCMCYIIFISKKS